jgi:hypothetical protein
MKICYFALMSLVLLASACNQNLEVVNSGERLEDSRKPIADPNARPLARAGDDASGEREIPPFVKAYFMHTWVEALYSKPQKWVARLNSDQFFAKAKLKGPVTCLTCHATNPELD